MTQEHCLPAMDLSEYESSPRRLIGELGGDSVDTTRPMIDLLEDHPVGSCAMCNGTLPTPESARWPHPRPGHEIGYEFGSEIDGL
jgi:hypothetical protein